jgi:putative lipoic acid-binding regulatory protein
MNIEYRMKNVYGADLKYPVSQDAHMICELTNAKTITDNVISIVQRHQPESTFKQVL